VAYRHAQMELEISDSSEGAALRAALQAIHKGKRRPPLFGLMHYAGCNLVVQPLTALEADGPRYLTISDKDIDRKALLAALKF
jgi:hypothetical protein